MNERPQPQTVGSPNSEAEAQIWIDALKDEGIPATYFSDRRSGIFGAGGDLLAAYPVVVREQDLDRARAVIRTIGGEASLAPSERPPAGPGNSHSSPGRTFLLAVLGVLAIVIVIGLVATGD